MSKFNPEVNSSVYQINMERVLLSSVFFNGYETLEMMIEKMTVEMFYLPAHQELYRVFLELFKEDMPIDEEMASFANATERPPPATALTEPAVLARAVAIARSLKLLSASSLGITVLPSGTPFFIT